MWEWRGGQLMNHDDMEQKYAEWCELQRLENQPKPGLLTSWGGVAVLFSLLLAGWLVAYGIWEFFHWIVVRAGR
jgi:hypothetical protein